MELRMPWFVEKMADNDPEFYHQLKSVLETALAPGALDPKTKYLIVLALDALKGASEGVKVLAAQARATGATEQEIREALRLAYYVAGMDAVKTSLSAFPD